MANSNEELLQAQLVERLKEMGMTEYEAETLVILTRLGTGTAKDVAEMDDVPRTRVYDAVETLHERGLVDIQHTTPRKFSVVSRETIVRKLDVDRENTITEINELFEQLGPVESQHEQAGVWTVRGREAVAQRVFQFVENADDSLIYMTVDELLTDAHVDRLRGAADRGVDMYIAGTSEDVESQLQDAIPSAKTFETLWEWADTPAGTLLVADESRVLVSVRADGNGSRTVDETAIWGTGRRNSLVVVLRAIFTWRLESNDLADGTGG